MISKFDIIFRAFDAPLHTPEGPHMSAIHPDDQTFFDLESCRNIPQYSSEASTSGYSATPLYESGIVPKPQPHNVPVPQAISYSVPSASAHIFGIPQNQGYGKPHSGDVDTTPNPDKIANPSVETKQRKGKKPQSSQSVGEAGGSGDAPGKDTGAQGDEAKGKERRRHHRVVDKESLICEVRHGEITLYHL